jgi:hypothetical protein
MQLNYTSREGGDILRRAAREASECDLPGAGWCLFDLRHDFADAWERFHGHWPDGHDRHFDLRFTRAMFPFVPGHRELSICKLALFFDRPHHCGCECPTECPCCSDPSCTHQELVLRHRGEMEHRFTCVASEDWPKFYHGVVECLSIGPLRKRRDHEEVRIVFPQTVDEVDTAYLMCRYILNDTGSCSTSMQAARITGKRG